MEQNNIKDLASYLLPQTYSKTQAIKRLRLINKLLNFIFFESKASQDLKTNLKLFREAALERSSPEDLKELDFIARLDPKFFELFKANLLHLQLKQLEEKVLGSKNIVLYIPFEIPDLEMERIGAWFKQNLGQETIFEINFDPSLVGGLAISVNGAYRDFSLRQKIADNKADILRLLTGFK